MKKLFRALGKVVKFIVKWCWRLFLIFCVVYTLMDILAHQESVGFHGEQQYTEADRKEELILYMLNN